MSLSESHQESLNRLKELGERLAEDPSTTHRRWLRLKADNLFLLALVSTLVVLAIVLSWFVKDAIAADSTVEPPPKSAPGPSRAERFREKTREVPLGEFESITRAASAEPGNVVVLQYEAYATANANHGSLNQSELLIRNRKHRLRAAVELVMNRASANLFEDPELTQLRQSLATELNDVLGGNRIQDVQFSNFMRFEVPDSK